MKFKLLSGTNPKEYFLMMLIKFSFNISVRTDLMSSAIFTIILVVTFNFITLHIFQYQYSVAIRVEHDNGNDINLKVPIPHLLPALHVMVLASVIFPLSNNDAAFADSFGCSWIENYFYMPIINGNT